MKKKPPTKIQTNQPNHKTKQQGENKDIFYWLQMNIQSFCLC